MYVFSSLFSGYTFFFYINCVLSPLPLCVCSSFLHIYRLISFYLFIHLFKRFFIYTHSHTCYECRYYFFYYCCTISVSFVFDLLMFKLLFSLSDFLSLYGLCSYSLGICIQHISEQSRRQILFSFFLLLLVSITFFSFFSLLFDPI